VFQIVPAFWWLQNGGEQAMFVIAKTKLCYQFHSKRCSTFC